MSSSARPSFSLMRERIAEKLARAEDDIEAYAHAK